MLLDVSVKNNFPFLSAVSCFGFIIVPLGSLSILDQRNPIRPLRMKATFYSETTGTAATSQRREILIDRAVKTTK